MTIGRRSFLAAPGALWAFDGEPISALAPGGAIVFRQRRTFPLALYHVPQLAGGRTAGLRAAREAGFSVVHCPPTREALDEVAAHGLGAWVTTGSDPAKVEEIVRRLATHPALLYWEIEDEPSYVWNKPGAVRIPASTIRDIYALLRRLDPARLVYLNHSPTNLVSTLQQYNPGGDLIATDVYPVLPPGIRIQYGLWPEGRHGDLLNRYISQIGPYVDKMREVAGPERAVLMVLQGFAWEMLRKEGDRDPAMVLYPTSAELLFMACQSIIHGVNGLIWWGLQSTPAGAPLWPGLAGVARLLHGLEDVLLSPPAAAPIEIEYHDTGHSLDRGLEWRAWRHGPHIWWMAVNADPNPLDVTVRGLNPPTQLLAGPPPRNHRLQLAPFATALWQTSAA